MKKSRKFYGIAAGVGCLLMPFVIIMDRQDYRNPWYIGLMSFGLITMFVLAWIAIKLEERGE